MPRWAWALILLIIIFVFILPNPAAVGTYIGNAIDSFSTLDVGQWHQDMDSPQVKDSVDADQKLAAQYGLRINAPSIVVDGPSGTKVLQDGPSKAEVDAAVADVSSS